jgi:dTDP-4-amino-4,6-dideoxygalactose transaminase
VTTRFLDLLAGVAELQSELDEAWARVRDRGVYILGPEVEAFEEEFAAACGVRHCVGLASGTDALRLLLHALGVGEGDEVIVPAYTAVASWMAVTAAGATPVGVDVDEGTLTIDPALILGAVTPRTRAIIAVHLFGTPADIDALRGVADEHGLLLLEDAAQAHGARLGGRPLGSLTLAAAFSFYPTKNLGALGDGGAVTTDDGDLAERLRRLREYGWNERRISQTFGVNSRLDELQAAFLRVRLLRLDGDNARRRRLAALYADALAGVDEVLLPMSEEGAAESVWHVYAARVRDRELVRRRLQEAGVETLVHYDPLPHQTPAYRAVGWDSGAFPVAERVAATELSLPLYPQLRDDALLEIAARLGEAVRR